MDNLTHSLTGLMMARVGLGRTTGTRRHADDDPGGKHPGHRCVSSGFPAVSATSKFIAATRILCLMAPVMALLPLLLAGFRGASINWRSYLACLLGVLSHLALDLTNVYGVRLLLPFSSRWLRLDMTDIVDPWILLIFFWRWPRRRLPDW